MLSTEDREFNKCYILKMVENQLMLSTEESRNQLVLSTEDSMK